jgi:cobalamin biosynthesis protein CbiG
VLVQLLEDPDPRVRAAAAAGLGQTALWAAAPQLLQHLHDPDWSVRRSAAAALRRLGPVGRLCLRRALDDPDPRTVEIARHVLDLPESALGLQAR